MKQILKISKYLFLALLTSWIFTGCQDEENYMAMEIIDMNYKITNVDKEIAQPGDVVTFAGTDLDQVYKIMLNTENVTVNYTATPTELKMTVPSAAPLGDVITVSLFFSGKGLAQRALRIISPPVIFSFSPAAGTPGVKVTVYGRELYLTQEIFVGTIQVPSFVLVDDRELNFTLPEGSTGGTIKLVTATGGESLSPTDIILGTEILINDFDVTSTYYKGISANGNLKNPTSTAGDFPRGHYTVLTIIDAATSWGGNVDFYLQNLPEALNEKVSLSIDLKTSKAMNVSIMVQGPANVYGLTKPITTAWQTIVIPFSEMGTGYGNGEPFGQVEAFKTLTAVKIQPPASASNNNFGETVSIDNIKFIIAN